MVIDNGAVVGLLAGAVISAIVFGYLICRWARYRDWWYDREWFIYNHLPEYKNIFYESYPITSDDIAVSRAMGISFVIFLVVWFFIWGVY